jgi:beta-lactamase superfamily II metal-dependent hydrolase
MLQACEGDFFWISYGENDEYHILVDGGTKCCAQKYTKIIKGIFNNNQKIEAIIMTHIDCDHIEGACEGINNVDKDILQKTVGRILFNTCEKADKSIKVKSHDKAYGVREGILFKEVIENKGLKNRLITNVVAGQKICLADEAVLYIISPGQKELLKLVKECEDYEKKHEMSAYSANLSQVNMDLTDLMNEHVRSDSSVNNASSIAFIFEYKDIKAVFLGDAKPTVCISGLKDFSLSLPYNVDIVKLSHHGSMSNINDTLIKTFKTRYYLLSTNGNQGNTPQKVTIAKLLKNNSVVKLICNYNWWQNVYYNKFFTDNDKSSYINTGKLQLEYLTKGPLEIKDGLKIYGEYGITN